MRRRAFVAMTLTAAAWSLAGRAQRKAMRVIGFLNFSGPPNRIDLGRGPVTKGLNETGYVEGQNVTSVYRWADDHYDRLPALAGDLVSRKVDLIITIGGTPAALAAKSATSTIPIIFTFVGDPVGSGLVVSLAWPGGNLTGFSNIATELTAKRLELLSELVPRPR
jgi:putative ABC transport system substrate-binding protein